MTMALKLAMNRLVAIKFTVDDNASTPVFAYDRLISGGEVNDTKACVAKSNATVFRNPMPLAIRAAMKKALSSSMQRCLRYRKSAREKCYDSAHYCYSRCCKVF